MAERHPQPDEDSRFPRTWRGTAAQDGVLLRSRSSGDLCVGRSRRDAHRIRPRGSGQLPDGWRGVRRAESQHPAALGGGETRGFDGYPGHPGHRQRRSERLRRHQGHLQHRRRCVQEGDRGARRPIAEAVRRVRRHHESDERHGRRRLTPGHTAERSRAIEQITTVVIGAGHAGLATSRCLSERSIDHVVLERGDIANSWRRERWDSLRLLTPNWQSRLPGYRYDGADPDGFMTMPEVVAFVSGFATAAGAPVRTHTTVTSVRRAGDRYQVTTPQGELRCRTLVLATGA